MIKDLVLDRMEATIATKVTEAPLPVEGYEQLAQLTCYSVAHLFGVETEDEWLAFMAGVTASIEMTALMNKIAMATARTLGNKDAERGTMVMSQSLCEALNGCLELGLQEMEDK